MAEGRKRGRWYWHCHACGQYVPREQDKCSCGATKERTKRSAESASRPPLRSAGSLAFGVGMVLLWLVLLWLVLREHTPPPAERRRLGASEAPAAMTQRALDSRAGSPHTSA